MNPSLSKLSLDEAAMAIRRCITEACERDPQYRAYVIRELGSSSCPSKIGAAVPHAAAPVGGGER